MSMRWFGGVRDRGYWGQLPFSERENRCLPPPFHAFPLLRIHLSSAPQDRTSRHIPFAPGPSMEGETGDVKLIMDGVVARDPWLVACGPDFARGSAFICGCIASAALGVLCGGSVPLCPAEAEGLPGPFFGRRHQQLDCIDDGDNLPAVPANPFLKAFEPGRKGLIRREHLTQASERPNDIDTGLHSLRRIQDAGGHDGPVLGEGIGSLAPTSASCV